jgi:hypothetical protein
MLVDVRGLVGHVIADLTSTICGHVLEQRQRQMAMGRPEALPD